MDFFPFPIIDAAIANAEEAPMNSLHVPSNARNKVEAKRFLAYVLRADVQEQLNRAILLLPVNLKSAVDDHFIKEGSTPAFSRRSS